VFFDNPGGTQTAASVIHAMVDCLTNRCANIGGVFGTTRAVTSEIQRARLAAAALFNAPGPENIAFGNNMTTLTFQIARSLEHAISPGDEIIVTDLDHDANVVPWLHLQARGAVIKRVPLRLDDCTIDIAEVENMVTHKTRLLAITAASNASGTMPDVKRAVAAAKSVGALTYVDAVQFAPHRLMDVHEVGCDFMVCSAYKFFGPHVGLLYGTADSLKSLPRYKVRPAPELAPFCWETGTQNHEGIAGTLAAIEYLAAPDVALQPWQTSEELREQLIPAFARIEAHESSLCFTLIDALQEIPGVRILGITDPARKRERLCTVSFVWDRLSPRDTVTRLAESNINAWSGNYYAYEFMRSLGLEDGAVRLGPAHYNTLSEVDRVVETLKSM
jgi:cysteine desulfurase family protein (TIGR01976 family)